MAYFVWVLSSELKFHTFQFVVIVVIVVIIVTVVATHCVFTVLASPSVRKPSTFAITALYRKQTGVVYTTPFTSVSIRPNLLNTNSSELSSPPLHLNRAVNAYRPLPTPPTLAPPPTSSINSVVSQISPTRTFVAGHWRQ